MFQVEHADGNKGKVFFYCQNNFLPLLQLKTAERLFILVMCEKECLGLFNHSKLVFTAGQGMSVLKCLLIICEFIKRILSNY